MRNSKYSESEALKYLEKKAKEGNPYAQFSYGSYYADFEFWPYDSQKAFYWFSKAAEKNHPAALNNLALMYIFGNGVKKDVKKGRELMLKAAELGVEYSQYSVAKVYARLDDIIAHNANYKEAFKCFEILKGCLASKYDIGECIFHGRGLPEDKSKAVKIWESMSSEVMEKENNNIIFTIENPMSDSSEIDCNRLFDRFYTGDKSRHNGSTGLGLAVVKTLVAILGGNIVAKVHANSLIITLEL